MLKRISPQKNMKKMMKNAGILLTGSAVSSLLYFVAITVAARTLGADQFGVMVLITTYSVIVGRVATFQSWQAVIKYGASEKDKEQKDDFAQLIKFGFLVDVGSAIFGAAAAAAGILAFLRGPLEERNLLEAALFYNLVLLFNFTGVFIGVLRLYDRFTVFAYQNIISAGIKLGGVIALGFFPAGIKEYILLWTGSEMAGSAFLIIRGWKELKKHNLHRFWKASIRGTSARNAGLTSFLFTTNIHATVKTFVKEMDLVLLGVLIGPAAVGIFKIVKQLSGLLNRFSDPLYQAIYPELASCWDQKNPNLFREMILRPVCGIAIPVLSVWIGFYFCGEWVLGTFLSPEYVSAYTPALIYMLAVVISILSFPFHPAMLAMGLPEKSFLILLLSTGLYTILLLMLTGILGITGTALSYLGFYLIWAVLMSRAIFSNCQLKECQSR